MNARDLTQQQAAVILGTDQAKVSNIARGRLDGFSIERLFGFLQALGYDVDIRLRRARRRDGRITMHPLAAVG